MKHPQNRTHSSVAASVFLLLVVVAATTLAFAPQEMPALATTPHEGQRSVQQPLSHPLDETTETEPVEQPEVATDLSAVYMPQQTEQQQASAQASTEEEPLTVELITILPTGFEPAEITRPKGRFILAVDNRSELEDCEFEIKRVGGNRLHRVRVPREKLDWRGIVELPAGTYVVTEVNHPDWVCRITITP